MKKIDLFQNAETISSDQLIKVTGGSNELEVVSNHHDNGDSYHDDNGNSYHDDNGSSLHSDNG
jgi:hypothetical protein